jgi:hypothetical protein
LRERGYVFEIFLSEPEQLAWHRPAKGGGADHMIRGSGVTFIPMRQSKAAVRPRGRRRKEIDVGVV